jgi:integrase/recombinase XerD
VAKLRLMTKSAVDMETAFNDFIRYSKAKNLSADTIDSYERHFKKFHFFYNGDIADITGDTVLDYIEHLQEKVSPQSVNTALRHLRAILNYWSEQEYIKPFKVKLMKVNDQIKDTYTDQEITKLLKKPDPKKSTFREFRTWAVINFLVGTGCRVGTLVAVRIGDIDFQNDLIGYAHTKNKKAQYTPISRQLGQVIQEYLRHRGGEDTDLLFPTDVNTKMLRTSVAHDISKYNKERGVNKTSAHLFRHTFAKNWVLAGGDVLRLQKILGHSTLAMSQHYANLYGADLKQNFEEYNLLSRLKGDKIKLAGGTAR